MNFLLFIVFFFKTLPVSPTHHPTLYSTSTLHNLQSFLSASLVSCLFACLFNYFKSNRAYRVFFFLWLISCSMMPWVHPCFHKWQDFILFFNGWITWNGSWVLNRFPGDADAVGPWTELWVVRLYTEAKIC